MPLAPSGSHGAPSLTSRPCCGVVEGVVGCCADGGVRTVGGFGRVVVVVVVVVVEVLTEMSVTFGVGTMLTDWCEGVFCELVAGDEMGLESKLHPTTPSTTSRPMLAKMGTHNALRVNTGCTVGVGEIDLQWSKGCASGCRSPGTYAGQRAYAR